MIPKLNTHATAEKKWTTDALNSLAIEQGFRLRGLEVTRLDTFIDAAFAFVLTLLVISFDEIPSNNAELLDAVKRIPSFAASFATLMMFWVEHRTWSRRYGLENTRTIMVSLGLIFVVLVYVYPLRTLFEGMFFSLSNEFLPANFQIASYADLRTMFITYSVGFLAMSGLMSMLFRASLVNAETLALNDIERLETLIKMRRWLMAAIFAIASIVCALTLPDAWITAAGYLYFLLIPATWLTFRITRQSDSMS